MAQYDLTKRMAPYLDLHLVIPLLEFIGPKKIYEEESLCDSHRNLLQKTNMIDNVIETYMEGEVPEQLLEKREALLAEKKKLKEACDPLVQILEQEDVKALMEASARDREGNSKILEVIQTKYKFKMEMLDPLLNLAKFHYESGNYTAAAICLYYYRNVVPQNDVNFYMNYLSALYGKLACEILGNEWGHAKDDLARLRAYIDSEPFDSELELLQHRAWVLHLSLYVHFHKERDDIIDMFLGQQSYLNTIQILCPHLLRYVTVAVVSSKNKQQSGIKELIRVVEAERQNYRDPVVDFVYSLYVDYNFDEAQQKLRDCEPVLSNDYFLSTSLDEFQEGARLLMFEMACRIHKSISIGALANYLGMQEDQAEECIAELVRTFRIDGAKLDSQNGQVSVTVKPFRVHDQIVENAKRLNQRSQGLAGYMDRLKKESLKNESGHRQ